jgi:hypothetical protein
MSSCGCTNDLSGCDVLKVISYSIVSVDPYIKDVERVVVTGQTVATTDDLTEADFTAWAIAKSQREYPEKFKCRIPKYLRVCYSVNCRLNMPCTDYQKEQVDALRAINRSIRGRRDWPECDLPDYCEGGEAGSGLPAKTRD